MALGKLYGRPRIKVKYGQKVGKVQRNIRRATRKGGLKLHSSMSFGFGK